MDLGQRIKEYRESMGMSQNELAKKSGLAQSSLSYLESGEKSPSVETLECICKGLGIPLSDLISPETRIFQSSFSKRLRIEREALNLSVEEKARKVGIPDGLYKAYENNRLIPNLNTIYNISRILNASIDYLIGESNEKCSIIDKPNEDIITRAANKLGHEGSLSDEEKDKVELAIKIALAKNNK